MKWIVKFVENHLWFVERSNQFMRGTPRVQYLLRYPIAWIRFMSSAMGRDVKELTMRKRNSNTHRHYMWQSVKGTTRIDIEDVPRRSSNE